jgi:hypothetical protein
MLALCTLVLRIPFPCTPSRRLLAGTLAAASVAAETHATWLFCCSRQVTASCYRNQVMARSTRAAAAVAVAAAAEEVSPPPAKRSRGRPRKAASASDAAADPPASPSGVAAAIAVVQQTPGSSGKKKSVRPIPSPSQLVLGEQAALQYKAQRIAQLLARLYPNPPIPLDHGSTFQLLCAVLLSAQVRAAAGHLCQRPAPLPNPPCSRRPRHLFQSLWPSAGYPCRPRTRR